LKHWLESLILIVRLDSLACCVVVRTKERCVVACVALWLVSVWRGDRALTVWLCVGRRWLGELLLIYRIDLNR